MNWSEYEEQERKHERWALRRIIVGIIAALVLGLGGAFWLKKALADEVRTPDGQYGYIRHEAQCDDADILAHLARMGAGAMLEQFKKGTLTHKGENWRSCWIEVDGTVYSVDSEGAQFQPLPVGIFKKTGTGA